MKHILLKLDDRKFYQILAAKNSMEIRQKKAVKWEDFIIYLLKKSNERR